MSWYDNWEIPDGSDNPNTQLKTKHPRMGCRNITHERAKPNG